MDGCARHLWLSPFSGGGTAANPPPRPDAGRPFANRGPRPQGMSLLTDKPMARSVFETLFYWFPNVDKAVRKRLLSCCFNYIREWMR